MAEPSSARPLPRAYYSILSQLFTEGGAGELDRYGRIVVGPSGSVIPGDTVAWLRLVAHGLVAGEDGRLILTEAGRAEAQAYQESLVRNA